MPSTSQTSRSTGTALWHLARPRMVPFMWLLVLGGYGFAHWDRALMGQGGRALLATLAAWSFLHAGTLWFNARVDQDEGEVLWGRSVDVPANMAGWSATAFVVTLALAGLAGPWVLLCAVGCVVLAVLYSHPASLWKGHPVGGPVVNAVGYGLLSPIAGFACAGVTPTVRSGVVLGLGLCGVMAAYYAAMAFQGDEDRARGYRTLVARQGMAAAVRATRRWMWAGVTGALVLAAVGWVPRELFLLLPLFVWVDRYANAWQHSGAESDSGWARGFANRLLVGSLVALTLLVVLYVRDSFQERPVAGLATAAGHPPDRPLLSPRQMRVWEARQSE